MKHIARFIQCNIGVTVRRAAFLHCHNCDWSQDDFWALGGYNPVRYICEQRAADWEADLFKDRVGMQRDTLEEMGIPADQIHGEAGEAYAYGPTVVAAELRSLADSIDHMKWRTEDEWRRNQQEATCPQCGTHFQPDID